MTKNTVYYHKNKELCKKRRREYYLKNKKKIIEKSKIYVMNYPSPKGDGFPLSSNSFGVVQRLLRVVPTLVF